MKVNSGGEPGLCFLEASRVEGPAGDLAGLRLQTHTDEPLGTLNGVLIDPSERRVCYFVVERPGWFRRRKYLISTNCPAKVEGDKTLRLDLQPDELVNFDEFDRDSVREFTEEDAVEAMFAQRVA